jgi:hypothetical protein
MHSCSVQPRKSDAAADLPKASLDHISIHDPPSVLRDDESKAGMRNGGRSREDIQQTGPPALTPLEQCTYLRTQPNPSISWETLSPGRDRRTTSRRSAPRDAPAHACGDGSEPSARRPSSYAHGTRACSHASGCAACMSASFLPARSGSHQYRRARKLSRATAIGSTLPGLESSPRPRLPESIRALLTFLRALDSFDAPVEPGSPQTPTEPPRKPLRMPSDTRRSRHASTARLSLQGIAPRRDSRWS